MTKIVTISGTDFDFDALSSTAKALVANVTAADTRLEQLRADIAMIQLARDVYVKTLLENLPPLTGTASAPVASPVH